jgi:hypothetical protein
MNADIHTIRNIMIFFVVLTIISLLLTTSAIGYQIYLAKKTGTDGY